MQIKPKFPRFCGSVRYRNAGHLHMYWANDALQLLFVMSGKREKLSSRDLLEQAVSGTKQGARISTTLLEQKLSGDQPEAETQGV